jgi:ankyrin repeat protein
MGDIHVIQKMINRFRWSPFMKSYRQQTVLTGAIWYDRNDIVELVLGYEYRGDGPEAEKKIASLIQGIDKNKRNPMHYAYMSGNKAIIAMLDKFGYNPKKRRDINGFLPHQCTHMANSAYE